VWRSLGWTKSVPYNKAEVYDIAKSLQIPLSSLPCAVVINSIPSSKRLLISLKNDLTSSFREIFSRFQNVEPISYDDNQGKEPERLLISLENHLTSSFRELFTKLKNVEPISYDDSEEKKPVCFLSHNSKDKHLVRQVATSLYTFGIEVWFDEWEVLPGDSITVKIEEGLKKSSHLVVFLSKAAIESSWVKEEMNVALYHAISSRKMKVIPVILEDCETPTIISSYARIVSQEAPTIA